MSRIFYDHLVILEEIEVELDRIDMDREERAEVESLIDQIIHHRVLDRILTHLPRHHHADFLTRFHRAPYDPKLLDWLEERIDQSVQEHIKDEVASLKAEILKDIRPKKKK